MPLSTRRPLTLVRNRVSDALRPFGGVVVFAPVFLSVGKGKEFDRDLQAAGLPKRDPATGASFIPHSLRHFACMYLASGNALSDAERQAAMTHEARRMTTET